MLIASPGQNATGQNATGQNATGQNAAGHNSPDKMRWDKMPLAKMPLVKLPPDEISVCCLNMSEPMVISTYHKRCFAHTTLITGTPRHEH